MKTTNEEWRPIPGYERHYFVSSRGRIMRIAPGPGARQGRILKHSKNSVTGYYTVLLSKYGVSRTTYVHRVVAKSFRSLPSGAEVHHISGDKSDNSLVNLQVVSRSENMKAVARSQRRALAV